MMYKISLLSFLWSLCLPMANYAGELTIPFKATSECVSSTLLNRARTPRGFPSCRSHSTRPPCKCKPGPIGPSSLGTLCYGDFYLSLSDEGTRTVAPGQILSIPTRREGITIPGLNLDSNGGIVVSVPGIYDVSYNVTIEPNSPSNIPYTLALQLDGVIVPGSVRSVLVQQINEIGIPPIQTQIQGQSFLKIIPGQVISVVNADAVSTISVVGSSVEPDAIEQASLVIRKIDNLPEVGPV